MNITIPNEIIESIKNGSFGKKYTLSEIAEIIMQGVEESQAYTRAPHRPNKSLVKDSQRQFAKQINS